jgi:hypothetical protein
MKISRREVIGAAVVGTAVVATTGPTFAGAAEPVPHPLMLNVQRMLASMEPPMQASRQELVLALNQRLLTRHGDELFGTRHMRGPVDEVDGTILEAKTRKFLSRWQFEAAQDQIAMGGQDAEEAIINNLVDEIASEFRREIAPGDRKVYPYIPIMSAGIVIEVQSFSPVMAFLTRYATA